MYAEDQIQLPTHRSYGGGAWVVPHSGRNPASPKQDRTHSQGTQGSSAPPKNDPPLASYPGGHSLPGPQAGGSTVVVLVVDEQIHSLPPAPIHWLGPLVVEGATVVVVESGKQGTEGILVVPGAPPTTSPPRIHAVLVHSNGCGQYTGRTQPHGPNVVVVAVVVEVVLPPGSNAVGFRLSTAAARPQLVQDRPSAHIVLKTYTPFSIVMPRELFRSETFSSTS